MKTREIFQNFRFRREKKASLRVRLTLIIAATLVACILLGVGLFLLVKDWILLDQTLLLALDFALICILIGAVVTSMINKLFFAPIKKLYQAMEQVADGNYQVRLDDKSSLEEIMEIYSGFNMMAHELNATEILQSDFVSNVSHEVKTPVTAIEGYSMLLQGSGDLTPEQTEYVEKIIFNTQRLSSLVGSVLLLSKLENQQIPTGKTRYRLDEQIRQSIVALEPAWEKKEIEFDVDLEQGVYQGNEAMMHHVWDNLIGNAIKFSPSGGTVHILLTKEEKGYRFTIEDQGPGISEDRKNRIFDKFYQGDNSHKAEGNGLGLALVKRILSMEGGEITVENLSPGCRFTVFLN